jgi:DNA-binding HxlR family transcriptional regulator
LLQNHVEIEGDTAAACPLGLAINTIGGRWNAGLITRVEFGASITYALTQLGLKIEAPFRALGVFGTALANERRLRGERGPSLPSPFAARQF